MISQWYKIRDKTKKENENSNKRKRLETYYFWYFLFLIYVSSLKNDFVFLFPDRIPFSPLGVWVWLYRALYLLMTYITILGWPLFIYIQWIEYLNFLRLLSISFFVCSYFVTKERDVLYNYMRWCIQKFSMKQYMWNRW